MGGGGGGGYSSVCAPCALCATSPPKTTQARGGGRGVARFGIFARHCLAGRVLRELDFFLLRTAPRDHQPPTAIRHQLPTASGDQPPTANHCRPPPTTNPQPPTAANHHQPPPTATNHQLPNANRQPPTANTWCARGLFWEKCATEHFFFPLRTALFPGHTGGVAVVLWVPPAWWDPETRPCLKVEKDGGGSGCGGRGDAQAPPSGLRDQEVWHVVRVALPEGESCCFAGERDGTDERNEQQGRASADRSGCGVMDICRVALDLFYQKR